MEIGRALLLLIVLSFAVKAVLCQDRKTILSIDCGVDFSFIDGWQTDYNYISTGMNIEIPYDNHLKSDQLNTLRVFNQQKKNCYTLPTPTQTPTTYFIRATFYYGNYDNLKNPPTFDIEFDGNKWATVETTMPPYYQYNEVVYKTRGTSVVVCLSRTQEGQFPFISTLEMWPLADNMYRLMVRDELAWVKSYRYNYGPDPDLSNWIVGYPEDTYNRIWESNIPKGTVQTWNEDLSELNYTTLDFPPNRAILYMVEAEDVSSPINLTFSLTQQSQNFISIYFTEPRLLEEGDTRLIDISVNNNKVLGTVEPQWGNCTELMFNTKSNQTLNVLISANEDSTQSAVVSAIEVYTASSPLVRSWTSQDDLDGLQLLMKAFDEQLNNWTWSGDPCLPNDTVWEWLGCVGNGNGNDPPRVTKIDLAGYGLQGPLPNFSRMQVLETIDLANNSLGGTIPSFLGTFPNLKLLDLSNNNFSGKIPPSILENKNLTCNLNGNPNINRPKNKKKNNKLALIIGLSVGLPVGLLLIIVAVYFLLIRPRRDQKKPTPNQQQATPSPTNTKPTIAQPTSPGIDQAELAELHALQNMERRSG